MALHSMDAKLETHQPFRKSPSPSERFHTKGAMKGSAQDALPGDPGTDESIRPLALEILCAPHFAQLQ